MGLLAVDGSQAAGTPSGGLQRTCAEMDIWGYAGKNAVLKSQNRTCLHVGETAVLESHLQGRRKRRTLSRGIIAADRPLG